ncbi:MAG: methyltransferase domain-containing protein [Lachnospiraceae bacterium]|nr:methyltransferase domain-containing protein [Lachnospiraceae bacterium]
MKIGSANDSDAVKAQYATSKGLDTRISFHDRFSTNKQGFGPWIVSNYALGEGMKVLELGCGTGSMWVGHEDLTAKCGRLVLTDLSEGMLETAKENLGERAPLEYRVEDIQTLSFADDTFDAVIANMMLYHVPDLPKGLREVRRVLKSGGTFYCATFGEKNFTDVLAEWFRLGGEEFHPNHHFTLQNGAEKLHPFFEEVTRMVYPDALHITDSEDLVTYLRSLASFRSVLDLPEQKIREILAEHMVDGAIDLPKEYGMFRCR